MSVSTKELFTAFFKGLAFAKGLNFGEKNRGMAEDRWITIHPWGMSQGEADAGEGKGYYRRIEINDETGEIEKGLGAGTNIKDLSKTLKDKKTEEKKKPESEKKTEEKSEKKGTEVVELHPEKENEKKLNFADKVKKIVSQEFRYAPGISAMGEFDAKYLEKQLNKLDPHEEGAEEALEEVDKAVKSGDMRQVIAVQNAISHYAHDKEGYKRSLKATRNSYKRTVKLYDDLIEKFKKVEAPREELKTKAKEFWNKHGLDIQDVDKALNNLEKKDGLGRFSKQLKLSDKYYEVLGQIEASKNQLEIVLKRTEKFNPAKDPLYDLKLRKDYVTKAKSAAKDYFNQHNIAMDSADFAEIQSLLNELDNDNNGLDLFINNVNIER